MFKAITSFFSRQCAQLERANAEVTWEGALDRAVEQISKLQDVDSDKGKFKLTIILDELRLVQLATQAAKSEAGHDSEPSAG